MLEVFKGQAANQVQVALAVQLALAGRLAQLALAGRLAQLELAGRLVHLAQLVLAVQV